MHIQAEYPVGTCFKATKGIRDDDVGYYSKEEWDKRPIIIGEGSVGYVVRRWLNGVDLQFDCAVINPQHNTQSGFFGQRRFFSFEDLKESFERL